MKLQFFIVAFSEWLSPFSTNAITETYFNGQLHVKSPLCHILKKLLA